MRGRFTHRAVLAILLICQFSICLATNTPDPNESTKYLNAVREFADNVLKYGRDTYGPKQTPLFVDGLNIHTHEPVKWIRIKSGEVKHMNKQNASVSLSLYWTRKEKYDES